MLAAANDETTDLDETLERAQAGDAASFADLVRRHQAMVFSLAVHVLRDRTVAEDIAQEVFLDLHRSIGRISSESHLVFWLRRVTSHRCIDEVRRGRHRRESPVHSVPERSLPPVSRDVLLEERLRELVRGLAIDARLVVTLRYQEDLQPSEIAALLDMSVNTVKSHLRRSLATLRQSLTERGLVYEP
jgi:RNA polymerase sigma-70 factor (ECF subfamily)